MDGLPPDILMNIFVQYLEDEEDDIQPRTYTPTISPWSSPACDPVLLGQVCRYWRSITFLDTFLWSRIYITDPQRSHIERTKLWIDRAGSHPLDLGIVFFTDPRYWDGPAVADILRIFITRLPYWRKVKFQLPYSNIQDLAAITTSVQKCNNLEVACVDPMSPSFDTEESLTPTDQAHLEAIWRTFHSSPKLYEVCWHDIFDTLPEHVPWSQIRKMPSIDLNLPKFLHVLVSCPGLAFLDIAAIPDDFPISRPHTTVPITHDSLTHFEIIGSPTDQQAMMAAVLLPSLRSLEIYQGEDSNSHAEPFPTIHKFLRESRCQLQRFRYANSPTDGWHDLAKLLECSAFETLQFLALDLNSIRDEVLLVLSEQRPDGSHRFMPRLEELELCDCQTTDGLLSKMITSRFNAFLKLAKLKSGFEYPLPFDHAQLDKLFPDRVQSGRYIYLVSRGRRVASEP